VLPVVRRILRYIPTYVSTYVPIYARSRTLRTCQNRSCFLLKHLPFELLLRGLYQPFFCQDIGFFVITFTSLSLSRQYHEFVRMLFAYNIFSIRVSGKALNPHIPMTRYTLYQNLFGMFGAWTVLWSDYCCLLHGSSKRFYM